MFSRNLLNSKTALCWRDKNYIEIAEVGKHGTTYGPMMCCTNVATVNNICDKIEYRHGEVEVRMSVFVDVIATK